jgi:AraC-like DNA-binding protein
VANSRISVVSHDDGAGRFEHAKRPASPPLEGVVLGYTGYSHRGVRTLRRREPAQSKVTLILNFGPRLRLSGPDYGQAEVDSFIAPIDDSYAITEEGDVQHGLQVDLSPLGAHMLLGVAMHDLSELVVDLEDVIGPAAPLLVERLFLAPDWATRFALLDSFIGERVQEARRPSPDIVWAWRRLSEASGQLAIGDLAEELGCSRRHLVARFREQIGPAPKTVARIMRFQKAAKLLADDDGRRLAEIAQGCGYYDQAHFNRDFRELAGTTPSALLSNRMPNGFGISA